MRGSTLTILISLFMLFDIAKDLKFTSDTQTPFYGPDSLHRNKVKYSRPCRQTCHVTGCMIQFSIIDFESVLIQLKKWLSCLFPFKIHLSYVMASCKKKGFH